MANLKITTYDSNDKALANFSCIHISDDDTLTDNEGEAKKCYKTLKEKAGRSEQGVKDEFAKIAKLGIEGGTKYSVRQLTALSSPAPAAPVPTPVPVPVPKPAAPKPAPAPAPAIAPAIAYDASDDTCSPYWLNLLADGSVLAGNGLEGAVGGAIGFGVSLCLSDDGRTRLEIGGELGLRKLFANEVPTDLQPGDRETGVFERTTEDKIEITPRLVGRIMEAINKDVAVGGVIEVGPKFFVRNNTAHRPNGDKYRIQYCNEKNGGIAGGNVAPGGCSSSPLPAYARPGVDNSDTSKSAGAAANVRAGLVLEMKILETKNKKESLYVTAGCGADLYAGDTSRFGAYCQASVKLRWGEDAKEAPAVRTPVPEVVAPPPPPKTDDEAVIIEGATISASVSAADDAQQFTVKFDPPVTGEVTSAAILDSNYKKVTEATVDPTKLQASGEVTVKPNKKLVAGTYTVAIAMEVDGKKATANASLKVAGDFKVSDFATSLGGVVKPGDTFSVEQSVDKETSLKLIYTKLTDTGRRGAIAGKDDTIGAIELGNNKKRDDLPVKNLAPGKYVVDFVYESNGVKVTKSVPITVASKPKGAFTSDPKTEQPSYSPYRKEVPYLLVEVTTMIEGATITVGNMPVSGFNGKLDAGKNRIHLSVPGLRMTNDTAGATRGTHTVEVKLPGGETKTTQLVIGTSGLGTSVRGPARPAASPPPGAVLRR